MTHENYKDAVVAELSKLPPDSQRSVLDFARFLSSGRSREETRSKLDTPTLSGEEVSRVVESLRRSLPPSPRPQGRPGRELLEFAGILTHEEAEGMRRVIEDVCERVAEDA